MTSGSVDYRYSGQDAVNGALRSILVLDEDETANTNQLAHGLTAANLLIKQWMGKADFAPGLKAWTRKSGTIFLQDSKSEYLLGPSGDHATNSANKTALSASAASAATTVTVTSKTGISVSDNIGIIQDDDTVHWTTIKYINPSSNVITLNTALTAAAASGKRVFTYTTKIQRPIDIININRRTSNDEDSELFPMTVEQYELIPTKYETGTPIFYYYEPLLTDGKVYIDTYPDDITETLEIKYLRPVEDLDAATDDLDFPQQWYRAIKWNLALELAPDYAKPASQLVVKNASESLAIAQNWYPETTDVYFQPYDD